MNSYSSDVEAVDALHLSYNKIKEEIAQVIVGQDDVVKSVLISIFSNGHCLLVGVPGLAKTLLVQTVAEVLDLSYIILADEINRTPPKTQAALLEAMQEKVVTVGGQTHQLPQPFFVLATQNPIEQEGTYPLPEAQLDRFMFNVFLTYPSFEEELQVVRNTTANRKVELKKILNAAEISFFQQLVRNIPIADNVLEYAVSIAAKTRPGTVTATDEVNKFLSWGAGPRASQFLVLGAKCHAAISGKYSPDQEDVRAVAESILRHRIVRNYKAEAEGVSTEMIISNLL